MSHWDITVGESDEWYTPAYIFDALGVTFDLDVASPPEGPRHVPARHWFSEYSLMMKWSGFVWMNAPFGGRNGLVPWLDKFFGHGNGIALAPDRTSAPWFQDAMQDAESILFLSPKVKFERPDGTTGAAPSSGVALFGMGEQARAALERAHGKIGRLVLPYRREDAA